MNVSMTPRALAGALAGALTLTAVAHAPLAAAQNTDLTSASVRTCNVKGVVRITVLGITTTTPLACVNPTTQTAPGNDDSALADTTTLGIPAVANLATVSAPFGESDWTNTPQVTWLFGDAGASNISLAQGMVQTSDVAGYMSCDSTAGLSTFICEVAMTLGATTIGGFPVVLPPQPIPLNYTIPVIGLHLAVHPLGLPLLNIPVSGQLVLNKLTATSTGSSSLTVEHAPLSLILAGSVTVLGIGAIAAELELVDYDNVKISGEGATAVNVCINDATDNPTADTTHGCSSYAEARGGNVELIDIPITISDSE